MNEERYKQGIIEAYKVLRLENSSIPSDIVDFIKDASLEKLKSLSKTQANPTDLSANKDFTAQSVSPKSAYIKCKTQSCLREVNKEGDYCGICRGI